MSSSKLLNNLLLVSSISSFYKAVNYVLGYLPSSSIRQMMHYDNMPMLYTAIFHSCEHENFVLKKMIVDNYMGGSGSATIK